MSRRSQNKKRARRLRWPSPGVRHDRVRHAMKRMLGYDPMIMHETVKRHARQGLVRKSMDFPPLNTGLAETFQTGVQPAWANKTPEEIISDIRWAIGILNSA